MNNHDHREIVPGCYRCELGADELDPRFDVKATVAFNLADAMPGVPIYIDPSPDE